MKGKVSAVLYERLKAMAEIFIEAEAISDALKANAHFQPPPPPMHRIQTQASFNLRYLPPYICVNFWYASHVVFMSVSVSE